MTIPTMRIFKKIALLNKSLASKVGLKDKKKI